MRLALDGIFAIAAPSRHGQRARLARFLGTGYPFSFLGLGLTNLALRLLATLGLVLCLRRRREPLPSLVLAASLGVLLSVPFIPPWDADLMRVYAATLPFVAVAPVVGSS